MLLAQGTCGGPLGKPLDTFGGRKFKFVAPLWPNSKLWVRFRGESAPIVSILLHGQNAIFGLS